MLSSLVQSPNQYLKINNSVIDNLKSNEINDKKDFVNESENIAEKNLVSPIQNVNLQTSNNTTSNSKNTPNKNFDYIHYCHKCGSQKLHDEGVKNVIEKFLNLIFLTGLVKMKSLITL